MKFYVEVFENGKARTVEVEARNKKEAKIIIKKNLGKQVIGVFQKEAM